MDQQAVARMLVEALKSSGDFQTIRLIGSVAEGTYDSLSDIDILVSDNRRPPWENVELASAIVEGAMGLLLRDWARSLIPEKYLISHFIPNHPLLWWIDLGCLPSPEYEDISRGAITQDWNEHLRSCSSWRRNTALEAAKVAYALLNYTKGPAAIAR